MDIRKYISTIDGRNEFNIKDNFNDIIGNGYVMHRYNKETKTHILSYLLFNKQTYFSRVNLYSDNSITANRIKYALTIYTKNNINNYIIFNLLSDAYFTLNQNHIRKMIPLDIYFLHMCKIKKHFLNTSINKNSYSDNHKIDKFLEEYKEIYPKILCRKYYHKKEK